jgi:hypothetical protein
VLCPRSNNCSPDKLLAGVTRASEPKGLPVITTSETAAVCALTVAAHSSSETDNAMGVGLAQA